MRLATKRELDADWNFQRAVAAFAIAIFAGLVLAAVAYPWP